MQSLKFTKEKSLSFKIFFKIFRNDIEAPIKKVLPFLPRKIKVFFFNI